MSKWSAVRDERELRRESRQWQWVRVGQRVGLARGQSVHAKNMMWGRVPSDTKYRECACPECVAVARYGYFDPLTAAGRMR